METDVAKTSTDVVGGVEADEVPDTLRAYSSELTLWSVVCLLEGGTKTCSLIEAPTETVARIGALVRLGRAYSAGAIGVVDVFVERAVLAVRNTG